MIERPPPRRRLSTRKRIGYTLATLLIAGVVGGALLEGILRLGWVANPRHFRMRVEGAGEDGSPRVLLLGDSFMEKTMPLGRLIADELGGLGAAVLNGAISGSGPYEYLAQMRSVGTEFQPDVVLLSYYVGNDLTNVQNHVRFKTDGEGAGIAIDSATTMPVLSELYAYHFVLERVRRLRRRFHDFDWDAMASAGIDPELIEDARALRINPWLLVSALTHKNYLLDNILMETEENLRAWTEVVELLTEIHVACESVGAELVIVIFPRSVQVNRSHFEFFEKLTYETDERTLSSVKPQRLLRELCADRQVPCLDLLPMFKERSDEEFYREKDDHLNDLGDRVAVAAIMDFLRETTAVGQGP